MKKIVFMLICVLILMFLAGCTSVQPGGLGSGEMGGKVGEATATSVFGFIDGDYGIMTAAANGGISKVTAFDIKIFSAGFFYTKYTTIVTGN